MELKYKLNKLRDLVTHELGVVPLDIVAERHKVVISFSEDQFNDTGLTVEEAVEKLAPYVPRKVEVLIEERD